MYQKLWVEAILWELGDARHGPLRGGPHNFAYPVQFICLIDAREQGPSHQQLRENAPNAPHVDLRAIV